MATAEGSPRSGMRAIVSGRQGRGPAQTSSQTLSRGNAATMREGTPEQTDHQRSWLCEAHDHGAREG